MIQIKDSARCWAPGFKAHRRMFLDAGRKTSACLSLQSLVPLLLLRRQLSLRKFLFLSLSWSLLLSLSLSRAFLCASFRFSTFARKQACSSEAFLICSCFKVVRLFDPLHHNGTIVQCGYPRVSVSQWNRRESEDVQYLAHLITALTHSCSGTSPKAIPYETQAALSHGFQTSRSPAIAWFVDIGRVRCGGFA